MQRFCAGNLHKRIDFDGVNIYAKNMVVVIVGISQPPSLRVVGSTSTSISISWKKPDLGNNFSSITDYYIGLHGVENHSNTPSLFVSTTSATITMLTSNTTYNIYVEAHSDTGQRYGDSSKTIGSTRK